MNYQELKGQIAAEINDFPLFFAFSKEQFTEVKNKLGAEEKDLLSIGYGGYIRKTDKQAFKALYAKHDKMMADSLKNLDFFKDAIRYELGNHEYCITYDYEPALDALGLNIESLSEAQKKTMIEAGQLEIKWHNENN